MQVPHLFMYAKFSATILVMFHLLVFPLLTGKVPKSQLCPESWVLSLDPSLGSGKLQLPSLEGHTE